MLTKHTNEELIVPIERIESQICFIRGVKIMLDADLAMLYQVKTNALNRAGERNLDRFPEDFLFQLTKEEFDNLSYQSGASSFGCGGRLYLLYDFTELNVAMLSSVLIKSAGRPDEHPGPARLDRQP